MSNMTEACRSVLGLPVEIGCAYSCSPERLAGRVVTALRRRGGKRNYGLWLDVDGNVYLEHADEVMGGSLLMMCNGGTHMLAIADEIRYATSDWRIAA